MKKIILICLGFIAFLWIAMFISSCTPIKYVMIDSKDSTKLVEVRKRIIYENYYDLHTPLYFNYGYYSRPYYNHIDTHTPIRFQQRQIIQQPRYYQPRYVRPRTSIGRY